MKKRKTVKKRYVIALVIVIAGLITLWRILNAPVPTYQTLIVRPGDLQQSVLATGKLDALRKVDVGAQVSGQLKTLSVAIGDKVKKDQLLGVIDPEQAENQIKEVEATLMELRAQRQQAEAELKLARVTYSRQQRLAQTQAVSQQAEAELKLARVTYSRQQRLAQTQAVSQQDLDTAATEMAVKQAQIGTIDAQIKRNQASLDTAKTNLDYTRIVAPMAGEVTQITTLQGQTVIAAQQAPNILTLADMSTMLVKAQVSEADVIHLKPGQKAWFTVLGDPLTRYEGQIKDVLPTPEKVNDAIFYYARFEVPNPNGLLRLDMTAQVHIQLTDVKNVLTIPLSALGDPVGDNRYKVKLLRNGETREREVTIGARNDTDVEIVKGLEAGDEVVIGEAKPGAAQ
ncbi:TPA: macrolide transporter subunit MacA [Escherichia coli]